MNRTNSYVLKQHIKSRLEGRGLVFKCERCDQTIEIGEPIVSKTREGKAKRFFHRGCWDKMFM